MTSATITSVPVEVILEILLHVDDKALFRLGGVCKRFRSIIHGMEKGSCRRYLPILTVDGIWQFRNCLTEAWKLAIDEEIAKHEPPNGRMSATTTLETKLEALGISEPESKTTRYLITPERVQLFHLLSDVVKSNVFTPSRPKIVPYIKPFDRAAYLSAIPNSDKLPEVFKLWILEYPSWAVCSWVWPGFPAASEYIYYPPSGRWFRSRNSNELSINRPGGQNIITRKLFVEYGDAEFDMSYEEFQRWGYAGLEYDLENSFAYIEFNGLLIQGNGFRAHGKTVMMMLDGAGFEHVGEVYELPMCEDGISVQDLTRVCNGWDKWRDWVHFLRAELAFMEINYGKICNSA